MAATPVEYKTAVISINSSWNVFNFRQGLIAAMQARGFRVVVLCPQDGYSDRIGSLGVAYAPISIDKSGVSAATDGLLLARYYRALRKIRPEIYLGYTAKPNVYGSLAAQALGIPVINNVSGLGTAFIKKGLLTWIVSFLYRLAFRRSAVVFFQNSEDLGQFTASKIVDPRKARLLPGSGINLERFRPALPEKATSGRRIQFLLIGRLLWDKGIAEYVAAARQVRAQLPEASFAILGFLDVENRTAVPRVAVEEWVKEGIIDYLGHSDDVRPFIDESDCLVLPSYREGLPRVLLEGGAMGKPLIATNVPGCRQVVDHGINGFLCNPRDANSLAEAMLQMCRLPTEERLAMGAAARAKVEAEYDERIPIESYLQAIDEAIAAKSHKR